MRLVLVLLGHELIALDVKRDAPTPANTSRGDVTTMPVGFVPTWPDQRWQPGAQP